MSALPAAAALSASSDDAIATSGRSDTLDDISIEMSTSVYDQSMRMPPPERTREDARPRVAMPEPLMASGVSAFFTYLFEHPAKALEDFRRLDCSRDGALEPKEFARWLAIYSVSEEAAHALFEYIDFDHNGAIQLEELLVVAQQVQQRKLHAEPAVTPLNSGSISELRWWRATSRWLVEYGCGFVWRCPPDLAAAVDHNLPATVLLQPTLTRPASDGCHGTTRTTSRCDGACEPSSGEPSGAPGTGTGASGAGASGTGASGAGAPGGGTSGDGHERLQAHLKSAETLLLAETARAVKRIQKLRDALIVQRLRTSALTTTHRGAAHETELRELTLRHNIMTDLLWQSVQASLVRLEPFAEARDAAADEPSMITSAFLSWEKVAGLGLGVERRLTRSGYGAAVLTFAEGITVLIWALTSPDRRPVPEAACDSGVPSFLAACASVATLCSLSVLLAASSQNVYWMGIAMGFLDPLRAVVPLVTTLARTIAYLRYYVAFAPAGFGVPCRAFAAAYCLTHLFVLTNLVLSDVYLRKAPKIRLACAVHILCNLTVNLGLGPIADLPTRSPANNTSLNQTIDATGIGIIDQNLGLLTGSSCASNIDARSFIRACDAAALLLTLPSMLSTIMRPQALAFTSLPCQLDTMTFYYDREARDQQLNGKERFTHLSNLAARRLHSLRRCELGALVGWEWEGLARKFQKDWVSGLSRRMSRGRGV